MKKNELMMNEEVYERELNEEALADVNGGFALSSFLIGSALIVGAGLIAKAGVHSVKHVANDASCNMSGEPAFDGEHWACK